MHTSELAVCNISMFGNNVKHFWLSNLSELLENFPVLEFPHYQDFYTLILVEEADGEVIIDNNNIRLDRAKTIIIKPHCINSININRKAKGKIICFTEDFFSLRYNNNTLCKFTILERDARPYIRISNNHKNKLNLLIKLLSDEYDLNKREKNKVLRSYLNILLYELERAFHPTISFQNSNLQQEKIKEFKLLIDQNFTSKKLPSAYAAMLHISPNYLNKICKENTGHTAGELIRRRIIVEAQRLLHFTNYSVNEIADKLGFENNSYFTTFFKKQTHITPEQFRKIQ